MNITQSIAGFLTAYAYENITIDNTVGGIGFTASNYDSTGSLAERDKGRARMILVTVEGASIRYRFDGGAPVATSSGHLVTDGTGLTFSNYQAIKSFRAIREAGVSATLRVTYMR